jgi:hypothetical protein
MPSARTGRRERNPEDDEKLERKRQGKDLQERMLRSARLAQEGGET